MNVWNRLSITHLLTNLYIRGGERSDNIPNMYLLMGIFWDFMGYHGLSWSSMGFLRFFEIFGTDLPLAISDVDKWLLKG